jgi:hypothetical protein
MNPVNGRALGGAVPLRYNGAGDNLHKSSHRRPALAYSLNDLYSGLRFVLRVNGVVLGVGMGSLLLVWPRGVAAAAAAGSEVVLWPLRLAGGLLLTYGVMLLLAAQERVIGAAGMIGLMIGNALLALVLLVGYLQGEFAGLGLLGQIGLVVLFVFCLVCVLTPLRYLRSDYVVL